VSLGQPWALALLALAAPVVAAYLFRLHNQRRAVASTILLRVLRDPQPAAQRARAKLRHRVSLALVLAGLAFAVIALVRPTIGGQDRQRVIAVLDTSASMGARDGDATRLARAADELAALADRLGPRDQLALVTTGAGAIVLVPPTSNHASVVLRARALVAAGATGDNDGDELALRLADALCREPARARVVVLSDGAGLTVAPGRCRRDRIMVGRAGDNLGVSALSARLLDGLGAHDVHLAVTSSAAEPRQVQVTLAADDRVLDVVSLEVPAHGTAERSLRMTIDSGGRLHAALTGPGRDGHAPDALTADDRASIALPDAGPVSVLLVTTRPQSLVASALRVHPRARLTVAAPGALPAGPFDLVLLEDDPRAALPASGHVVAFGLVPAGAPLALGGGASERGVVRWDFDAGWFRYVDLRDLYLTTAKVVSGGRAIIDSASGALAAIGRWGDRELIVTGFGVGDSDLGLRAAFPNLIANLIDWAAPTTGPRPPATGVLAAAESELTPVPPPVATAGGAPGGGGFALFTLAAIAAFAFLFGEQLFTLAGRRGRRRARADARTP
jgi:Mg-chelatase subunit ChlD